VPVKRASESVSRATGAIERFIERTLAPRLEELAGEIRGMRGEMAQMDKRITENFTSLRNETIARMDALRSETNARSDALRGEMNNRFEQINSRFEQIASRFETVNNQFGAVNTRIDALSQRLDDALNIRERLVALEARFDASQKRNGG
jgi:predicted  nucleic acid-binding Zn-ribbon protein